MRDRRSTSSAVALLAALLLPMGGCSLVFDPASHTAPPSGIDGGSVGDAGLPTIPQDQFCPTIAMEYCAAARRCCTMLPPGFDDMACRTNVASACADVYGPAVFSPKVEYDGAAAYRSLQMGRSLAQSCSLGIQTWLSQREGYFAGLRGRIPGGARCDPSGATETDLLIAIMSCEPGTVCRQVTDREWVCRAQGGAGDSCNYGFECAPSAPRCEWPGGLMRRQCGTGEAAGSPCIRGDECASNVCSSVIAGMCTPPSVDAIYCPSPD